MSFLYNQSQNTKQVRVAKYLKQRVWQEASENLSKTERLYALAARRGDIPSGEESWIKFLKCR